MKKTSNHLDYRNLFVKMPIEVIPLVFQIVVLAYVIGTFKGQK